MAEQVKPIPDGYPQMTPYPTVEDGAALVQFLSWWIATHVEDVSPGELERRGRAEAEARAKA